VLAKLAAAQGCLAVEALCLPPKNSWELHECFDIVSWGGAVMGNSQAAHTQSVSLRVNEHATKLNIDTRVTLLDALRNDLGLTGTKKGCDHGQCGACTVLVNGRRIKSCMTLAVMHDGQAITTVEGLGQDKHLRKLQQAFIKHDAFQCGFCTPGQLMSAAGLLNEVAKPTADQIRELMSGNICRCGAYPHIVAAILDVAV
jgi:xanthine dehydrogenase YagT iron-sulfur-binding subunit